MSDRYMFHKKNMIRLFCLIAALIGICSCAFAENTDEHFETTENGIVFEEGILNFEGFSSAIPERMQGPADISACAVSKETLIAILKAYPETRIRFMLEPYGVIVDTADELLVLDGITVTDLEPLKEIVPYLKNLREIDMCGCGIDDETMDALRTLLNPVKVVWTVDLRHWQLRTDATHFATWDYAVDEDGYIYTAKNVTKNTSKSLEPLKYCTELVALDLGHNKVTDISFLAGLKNLKYLIIALNEIKDISPLSGLTELKYLEIFNNEISDITPLAKLPKLEALYMTAIPVKDISCLYGSKTLKLLYLEGFRFDNTARKEIGAALLNCNVIYRKPDTNGSRAWRIHPYYKEMRRALGWRVD